MTSVQSHQNQRNDDHASRSARRAGKPSQNAIAPDAGAQFSNMVAASQRKLETDRLTAMRERSAEEDHLKKNIDFLAEENVTDDDVNASPPPAKQPAQDDPAQGQAGQSSSAAASTSHAASMRAMSEESPDWLPLASLLPAGADDGVFEVLMPNRTKVGVAISDMPAGLSYLLTPEDDLLAEKLRGNEMELEALLKRRIRRNVKVVVL